MNRPREFLNWAVEIFGPVALDSNERLSRFVEEAIELAHADMMPLELLNRIIARVYDRARGSIAKEVGQAQACLETYALSIGVSSDAEASKEFDRVRLIPKEEWTRRHAAKKAVGIAS